MGVMIEDEEQDVADMLRARAEERAAAALASAAETLAAPRPFAGAADGWARDARERDAAASDQQRPAPSRAAPPAAVADDAGDNGFVRTGVMVKLLQLLVQDERARAAQIVGKLEERIAMLEARSSKRGKNGAR